MTTTTDLDIRHCTSPAELFHQYPNENEPQPAYVELGLRDGVLLASYDSEIGTAKPFDVHHGIDRRYSIPLLTAEAVNRLLDEIAPLARRILDDSDVEWDGNNHVGVLGPDAAAAEEELERRLADEFADDDVIAVWGIDGATNGHEVADYNITPDTSDDRLREIEREILGDLASCSGSKVTVCPGLDDYLRSLRDELRTTDTDED